jgi:hypothetical protein
MSDINITKDQIVKMEELGINTKAKGFRRYYNAGLLKEIDEEFVKEVRDYWEDIYGVRINPILHIAFMNLTGKKELNVAPNKETWYDFIPYLNDMNIRIGYSDKNIYDTLIDAKYSAEIILKRIRGHYFDTNNELITYTEANNLLKDYGEDFIIKKSDSDNGKGVSKVKNNGEELIYKDKAIKLSDLEKEYNYNFVVQKVIKQHSIMAAPHPASVNTLRMVTLRWKGEIHYLLAYARFGANNDVRDHSVAGGISIGLNKGGKFEKYGLDLACNVHTKHPTTGYEFKNLDRIPNFEYVKSYVKDLHKKILHHDYVSWDIAIGPNEEPIFIESNFRGSVWRYQLASQSPVFGDMTKEIVEHIKKERANKVNRNVRSQVRKKGKKTQTKK